MHGFLAGLFVGVALAGFVWHYRGLEVKALKDLLRTSVQVAKKAL